jgi:hypothetical protein
MFGGGVFWCTNSSLKIVKGFTFIFSELVSGFVFSWDNHRFEDKMLLLFVVTLSSSPSLTSASFFGIDWIRLNNSLCLSAKFVYTINLT